MIVRGKLVCSCIPIHLTGCHGGCTIPSRSLVGEPRSSPDEVHVGSRNANPLLKRRRISESMMFSSLVAGAIRDMIKNLTTRVALFHLWETIFGVLLSLSTSCSAHVVIRVSRL
ncbi:hypothetical protein ASPTUDRAFT_42155, partial [Aspergillus tubingensis CBS 134.48]